MRHQLLIALRQYYFPALYQPEEEATQPAEELLRVRKDGDYGWPECYFDEVRGKLVLAPEYGGDGGKGASVYDDSLYSLPAADPSASTTPAPWLPINNGKSVPPQRW